MGERDDLASFPRKSGAGGARTKAARLIERRDQKSAGADATPITRMQTTHAWHARRHRRRPCESVGVFEFCHFYTTPGFQAINSGCIWSL